MTIASGVGRPIRGGGVTRQIVRYGTVVSCGYLLAIALYSAELDIGVPAYPGLGIVFVLNGLFNFSLLRAWVFPPSGRGVAADLGRFCGAAALSAVVNYASFAVLYSAIGLHATLAQRLAIVIAAPVSFLANRLWSFRESRSSRDGASAVGERAVGLPRTNRACSAQYPGRGAADDVPDHGRERQSGEHENCRCQEAAQASPAAVDRVRPPRRQHQHRTE